MPAPTTTTITAGAEGQRRPPKKQRLFVYSIGFVLTAAVVELLSVRDTLLSTTAIAGGRGNRSASTAVKLHDSSSSRITSVLTQSLTGRLRDVWTRNGAWGSEHTRFAPFTTREQHDSYIFIPNKRNDDLKNLNIRKWGCARRQESPLIFVHIGKAGGGSVRARLAASALDYSRSKWHKPLDDTTYYYPMIEHKPNTTKGGATIKHKKGVFANSIFNNFRPSFPQSADDLTQEYRNTSRLYWKTFEGTLPCRASTPLGQAIACPLVQQPLLSSIHPRACWRSRCNMVYVGHNLLGNELHWLPTPYLVQWWQTTPWGQQRDFNPVMEHLRSLRNRWQAPNTTNSTLDCRYKKKRKYPFAFYEDQYYRCVAPFEDIVDREATKALASISNGDDPVAVGSVNDWSPIYASLPVLRITVLREPFSWLISKYFWEDGIAKPSLAEGNQGHRVYLSTCDSNGTDIGSVAAWASPILQRYIAALCGEDCVVRLYEGEMTLEQAEQQAQHNLLHSFAVVGLMHETPTFYQMVTARAAYMNLTLNAGVKGGSHSSKKKEEYRRCSDVYQNAHFQEALLAASPELRVVQRLYQVGVQVNRAQLQEIQSCGTMPMNAK